VYIFHFQYTTKDTPMRFTTFNTFALAAVFGLAFCNTGAHAAPQAKSEAHDTIFHHAKELGLQTVWSADMGIHAMGAVINGKIWRDGEKSRVDTTVPVLNMKMSAIQTTRGNERVAYTLFHASKKYVVKPVGADAGTATDKRIVITELGREDYNGESCVKKRLHIEDDESGSTVILFSPANKNMPVKMTPEMAGDAGDIGAVVVFSNYSFAKPGADVFTVPADYTEAANEQEAMRGTGGGLLGALMNLAPEDVGEGDDEDAEEEAGLDAAAILDALPTKENVKDAAVNEGVNVLRGWLKR